MVFIVDDSRYIRSRLARMLDEINDLEPAIEAGSVAEVKKLLAEKKPDIMILDIRLTDGTGFDVLRLLRQKDIQCYTIILTNYASGPYRQQAMSLGADCFFDKSREFDQVFTKVRKFVQNL